jgi:hypothetical protein
MAGAALFEGKVAEQKTGEGKTLSAVAPLYLRALAGKGAHLVTVNDFLARIGAGWNGPLFAFLGMSVGVVAQEQKSYLFDPEYSDTTHGDERLSHLKPASRKDAYACDVTYGTNNEYGFDYLRDNMAKNLSEMVQRGHYFAIVDEVDSVLIDEARTPLIISAPDTDPTDKYCTCSTAAHFTADGTTGNCKCVQTAADWWEYDAGSSSCKCDWTNKKRWLNAGKCECPTGSTSDASGVCQIDDTTKHQWDDSASATTETDTRRRVTCTANYYAHTTSTGGVCTLCVVSGNHKVVGNPTNNDEDDSFGSQTCDCDSTTGWLYR